MPKTFSDVVIAMADSHERGLTAERLVLTDDSMETFLCDDEFSKLTEQRQRDTIGEDWMLPVELGDANYIVTESGERVQL